jgi:hypothetical protein
MLADQILAAIAAAPDSRTLDDIARTLWRAVAEGAVSDEAALAAGDALQARRGLGRYQTPGNARGPVAGLHGPRNGHPIPKPKAQRSPDRAKSIERRRRLAASGPMPPALAARFTVSQLAVMKILADEVKARGSCRLPLDAIAARAGVCRRTAQQAIREAAGLGLVLIRETRRTAWLNAPNVVTVISPEWRTWLRLASPGSRMQKGSGHGHRSSIQGRTGSPRAPEKGFETGSVRDGPPVHTRR